MRVPRGFPLHLFSAPDRDGWVLVVGRRLAALDLLPVNDRGTRKVVLVAGRRRGPGGPRATARARRAERGTPPGWVGCVLAAPDRLPFREGVASEVVVSGGGASGTGEGAREVRRVVAGRGRVLELRPAGGETWRPVRAADGRKADTLPRRGRFVIWPLAGGGFLVTRSEAPVPWPFASAHLGRPGQLQAAVYRRLSTVAPRRIPGRTLLVIRSREGRTETVVERRIRSDGPAQLGMVLKPGRNAILFDGEGVVKLPLARAMADRTRCGAAAVVEIARSCGRVITPLLPRPLESDFDAPQPWIREHRLPGRAATRGWWIPGHARRVGEVALPFLIALHRESAVPRRLTAALLEARLSCALRTLADACRASVTEPFPADRLLEAVTRRLEGREIPLVRGHGDYSARNLMLHDSGELAGVLDWDRSRAESWPLMDLLHLLAFRHRRGAARWFGRLLEWRLLPRRLSGWERHLVRRYMAALRLEDALWAPFVVLYWLELAALRLPLHAPGADRSAWLARNVVAPMPGMLRALSRPG